MAIQERTKWGIIGPGNIAGDFVKDLPLADKRQEIVAVLGRRESSVNAFADEHQINGRYLAMDQFIEEGQPEMVYIATPHPLHFEEALQCLTHKIPVLCEKPLCMNAEQAGYLINTAISKNTFLMEAMWIRFLPVIKKLTEIIRQGTIGEIVTVSAAMHYKAPRDDASRYFDPELGGGSLLDLGVYPVFLATLLLGKPDTIKAVATLTPKGVDEHCSCLLQYNGGAHAKFESSLLINSSEPAIITGTKGTVKVLHPWFERSPGLELNLNTKENVDCPFSWAGHGLQFEISDMLDSLREGKIESDRMPHGLSLSVLQVMDQVREQTGIKYEKDK